MAENGFKIFETDPWIWVVSCKSKPAVAKIHQLSRAAASVDRTRYTSKRHISYKAHHTQRLSLGIVKSDSRGILDSFSRLSASLNPRA